MQCSLSLKRKQLLYQSMHRGMKELDIILTTFAQQHLNLFDAEQLKEYENFLNLSDSELYNFFVLKHPLSFSTSYSNILKYIHPFSVTV